MVFPYGAGRNAWTWLLDMPIDSRPRFMTRRLGISLVGCRTRTDGVSIWRVIPAFIAAALIGCASVAQKSEIDYGVATFYGTWEGSFLATTTDSTGAVINFPVNLRLSVKKGDVRVFVRDDVEHPWQGVGGSRNLDVAFSMESLGTNAIVHMLHAGRIRTPKGSRWFETYLLALTVETNRKLLVHWLRMVHNVDTAEDDPDHAGDSDGDGVLLKVESSG
jgi:hypothetical protein